MMSKKYKISKNTFVFSLSFLQIFKTMQKSEFCVLIKHYFLMGKNTVQAKQWLDKFYLDSDPSETMVKRWYANFKRSCTDINDAECSGHPNSAVVPENTKKLYKLNLADHKLKLYEMPEELKTSEGSVFPILHECLSMRKLCSKWVQCLFTVNNSEHCLQLFQCNKKEFLLKYVTMDVDSSKWKPSKVTKDTNISRQGFGLRILGCTYQLLQTIQYQSHPCRKKVAVLFNPQMREIRGIIPFPNISKVNIIVRLEFKYTMMLQSTKLATTPWGLSPQEIICMLCHPKNILIPLFLM